jgi:hypothetical protein
MSAAYGGLGGQISPSFGNTATPQFGSNTSGQRFGDLQSALANIGYQRSGIQRERAMTLDDLTRQFQQTRRPIPGQFNRRGMLDSGQYQRSVGRTYEDELRRAGRYELGVQEALNALAAQQLGAEQQYSRGRLQDALAAAQATAQQMATIPQGAFPALTSGAGAGAALGIPTLPDMPPPPVVAPPVPTATAAAAPVAAPVAAAVAPPPPPLAPPEVVPDLAQMAGLQTAWERVHAASQAEMEQRRAQALGTGTFDYFTQSDGAPISTGFGSTRIAPTVFNPEGVPSSTINVPWRPGASAAHPDDMAAAAQRMVENMIYDPNLHPNMPAASRGGYTMQPGARARVAEAIREATG